MEIVFGIIIGILVSVIGWQMFRKARPEPKADKSVVERIRISVDSMRAVGELVVLKVYTQQVVTRQDHLLGVWGEKWMSWLMSAKKTAMIFDFVVDFRYNLRNPEFEPIVKGENGIHFRMPPFFYEIQLKDISIYDEKGSTLVPLLLPEWLGQAFGGRFSEKDKNQLIRSARDEAERLAHGLSERMIGDVQSSAETTLRSIAQGLGYTEITFHFSGGQPTVGTVDTTAIEASADRAVEAMDDGQEQGQ